MEKYMRLSVQRPAHQVLTYSEKQASLMNQEKVEKDRMKMVLAIKKLKFSSDDLKNIENGLISNSDFKIYCSVIGLQTYIGKKKQEMSKKQIEKWIDYLFRVLVRPVNRDHRYHDQAFSLFLKLGLQVYDDEQNQEYMHFIQSILKSCQDIIQIEHFL